MNWVSSLAHELPSDEEIRRYTFLRLGLERLNVGRSRDFLRGGEALKYIC